MAISDVSLTSGMRSNLISLQNTVKLLDRTQERLSTGKKVNTAIDNPINYFAAKSHTSRANQISTYKDGMQEGVQTIQAANNAITQLEALIENARGLGQAALSASVNSISFTVDTAFTANSTISIGGATFTAVGTGADSVTEFNVKDSDGNALSVDQIAANLTAKINQNTETGVAGNLKAVVDGNRITLTSSASDKAITTTTVVSGGSGYTLDTEVTSERGTYAAQYEEVLVQIDNLAGTAGYKGTNLLTGDTLSVGFEGGSISITGFNAYASDMGVNTSGFAKSTLAGDTNVKWALASNVKFDLNNIEKGLRELKSQASKLSSALSVINIQLDFSTSKINNLTQGADKLTAADTNEEGANMLMLQTRQSLSTSALSMSAQAAQSVLQLFQ